MSEEQQPKRLAPLRSDSVFGESSGRRKPLDPKRKHAVKSPDAVTRNPTWPYLIILLLSIIVSGLAMWSGIMYSQLQSGGNWSQTSVQADSLLTPPSLFPSDTDVAALQTQSTQIFLYFTADGKFLQPLAMDLKRSIPDAERLRMSLENLLRGPLTNGWESALPSGVRLRAVYRVGQEITIDLSGELASQPQGGIHAEWLCVQALVCTALGNDPEAKQVRILISGRPADVLWSEIDLSQTFQRDESLIVAQ